MTTYSFWNVDNDYPSPTVRDAVHLLKRILVESHYKHKPKTPTLNDCKLFIFRAEGVHFDLEKAMEDGKC